MLRLTLAVLFVLAQTTAAPPALPVPTAPSPAIRPDISGRWTLDADISADLTKVNLIPSANNDNGNRTQGRTRRGGGGGFGGFGGGSGNSGNARARAQNSAITLTSEEQTRLKAMADVLKTGWMRIDLALHEPSFVVNDARDRTLFFQTDGTSSDNHIGDAMLPGTTHWEDDTLVTEWPIGSDITVVYSYVLLANMKQLVVRVNRKDGLNVRPFDPDIRLIYKRSAPAR